MNASLFLQWHYLVFLLPLGVALLLLALSSLRLGGHRGGGRHGGHNAPSAHHAGGHARGVHHSALPTPHSAKPATGKTDGKHPSGNDDDTAPPLGLPLTFVFNLIGIGRAPLPMVLQMLALFWGVAGIGANQILLPGVANPTFAQMTPSLSIAFWSALIGARIGAEIIGRVLPQDESFDVSCEGLYGMVGKVVFPVTESGGRIHVYDDNKTLHDERCRIATGQSPLSKGENALIVDRGPDGSLLVERI